MNPHRQMSHQHRVTLARQFAPEAARRIRNETGAQRAVVECSPTPDRTIKGDTDLEAAAKRRTAAGATPPFGQLEKAVGAHVGDLLERIQRTTATVLLVFADGQCRVAASISPSGTVAVTPVTP